MGVSKDCPLHHGAADLQPALHRMAALTVAVSSGTACTSGWHLWLALCYCYLLVAWQWATTEKPSCSQMWPFSFFFSLSYHMGSQDFSAMQCMNSWIYPILTHPFQHCTNSALGVDVVHSILYTNQESMSQHTMPDHAMLSMPVWMKGLYNRQQSKWTGL